MAKDATRFSSRIKTRLKAPEAPDWGQHHSKPLAELRKCPENVGDLRPSVDMAEENSQRQGANSCKLYAPWREHMGSCEDLSADPQYGGFLK